jgi:hypothetical protein
MKPPGPEAPVVLVKWYDYAKWLLERVFEPRFLEDSVACRKGKGTHAGMRRALHHARRYPFALKCDLKRYFPSIDHSILTGEIARVVADARVMDRVGKILASHQDGVRREYGDDLSGRPLDGTPPGQIPALPHGRGRGLLRLRGPGGRACQIALQRRDRYGFHFLPMVFPSSPRCAGRMNPNA